MPSAVGVLGCVGHDVETVPVEQQAVFAGTEARMVERLPLERADRFPGGRAAREQQRGTRQGMVAEDGNIGRCSSGAR